ncbi:MAG: winged helix-turn-helix transcriptional regulator [Deltaproteobacteria bacterium]|nr:winged helix-turn-helix transcriptional regulator [Deltaproteobacteria bacterium]MBW1924173.1 winged helix-turn-helix transcriptional regulator [Deltaproteobacteria bacterium]MBW1951040.1 winged helix-turn-helix transcriptional regulator [Deltaproteobacteria bacterium]MBW2009132.1 winged helix-turn-helix transcriptional regulator [Deltaproteobacteria bacterium]MBW2104154.1 winged helix-turn-helix transcriptional regulator [Deltaproteobacteria bacterium]
MTSPTEKATDKKEEEKIPRGCRLVHLERVRRAIREAIEPREIDRLAETYKVLGDPTRLRILAALGGGEMCVCDLAAFLGLTESAVSHQLRRLKDTALVKCRREGKVLYYSLDDAHVAQLVSVGLAHVRE